MAVSHLFRLLRCTSGTAAVEFALVMPLLMLMLFAFWEYGRYFEGTHAISKAARDGARFAARQPWSAYDCGGVSTLDVTAIQAHVVRTLGDWQVTAENVSVSFTCNNSQTGIYRDLSGGAPVVMIVVSAPYSPLFGNLVTEGFTLSARAESAVMGI